MKEFKINNLETPRAIKICKCGHNHIAYLGEEAPKGEGYYKINECDKCDCEKFEIKKLAQNKHNAQKQKNYKGERA